MTPANKIDVVKQFVERDLIVGMCGDGGNDCGALRVAHAGMALSDAEASVVSPFTSKSKTCVNVVDLLREGKAALHTNLSSYKFLIMYGQLFSVWKVGTLPPPAPRQCLPPCLPCWPASHAGKLTLLCCLRS